MNDTVDEAGGISQKKNNRVSLLSALAIASHSRKVATILDHPVDALTLAHLALGVDPARVPDSVGRGALTTLVFRTVFGATLVTIVSVSNKAMHVTLVGSKDT